MYLKYKLEYFLKNWRLGIHLILRTKRFGVNGKWWSSFPSFYFGDPTRRIILNVLMIYPIIFNYKMMKYRAVSLGFLHPDTVRKLGWDKRKHAKRGTKKK